MSAGIFGHISDGRLHCNILTDNPDRSGPLITAVQDLVASVGGSITAEHGAGQYRLGKASRLLSAEHLNLQENLMAALDPVALFTPGKHVRPGRNINA